MTTLFVSAYFDISTTFTQWRIQQFRLFLNTGVPVCLFTNDADFQALQQEYPHLQVRFFDSDAPRPLWLPQKYDLPLDRTESKDTADYIALQHLKTYFVTEAIRDPWDHYAWVDPHLFSLFSDKPRMAEWVRCICNASCADRTTLVIPGYNKFHAKQGTPTGGVDWRFLGGFFWGHRDALLHFHDLVVQHIAPYVEQVCGGTLYWELNYWAWLEVHAGLSVQWYAAGNDETRLTHFPLRAICTRLMDVAKTGVPLPLPERRGFRPSSLSHVYDPATGVHRWLVRYINYTLDADKGHFVMHDDGGSIRSENLLVTSTTLDWSMEAPAFSWVTFPGMDSLVDPPLLSYGLEDARLFHYRGCLWAIGCNVDKTVEKKYPQMAVSKMVDDAFCDVVVLHAAHCEKNWIPFFVQDTADPVDFVYSWGPRGIQWGRMNLTTGEWCLSPRRQDPDDLLLHPLLQGCKGSSMFVPFRNAGSWVGVVHSTQYTEGRALRDYWHHVVVVDDTRQITATSGPLYFDRVGVEYCIGFWYDAGDDTFHFWVSRVDADPVYVVVPATRIPMHGKDFPKNK